ncbi:MAG: hypothetical protein QHJ34_08175 [bacterium]|jgi:hypothetical protein|nr:hypothetical protein [candidate division KSB1 bacterium]MDH7560191.1 hypothetical protein [bacterium]
MAKVWTEGRLKLLKQKYGTVAADELAGELGVSIAALQRKAKELKLKRKEGAPEPPPEAKLPRADGAILGGEKVIDINGHEEEMLPSGLYILTEEGWKPVMMRKSRIAPR